MDALLLLMVAIWAGNYSLVKRVFAEIPPLAFNALRLTIASLVFLALLWWSGSSRRRQAGRTTVWTVGPIGRRDWVTIAGLGVVGHYVYQLCFIVGFERTSVANTALILGCSPVATTLLSAAVGHERVLAVHWAGALLSLAGLYLVAGRGANLSGESLTGDLLLMLCVVCWGVYTVGSRSVLGRHSPLVVTGLSMAVGTALFVPTAAGTIASVDWVRVSPAIWLATAASALLALNVAYLIWYTAVQRIGNARTSVYSNMVPVAALLVAWLWLGERVDVPKLTGAGAILAGVGLTRVGSRSRAALAAGPPAEE